MTPPTPAVACPGCKRVASACVCDDALDGNTDPIESGQSLLGVADFEGYERQAEMGQGPPA